MSRPRWERATHYHADYVMPGLERGAREVDVQLGKQIFYRWRGAAGDISSFVQHYAGAEPAIQEASYRVNRFAPPPPTSVTLAGN